MEEFGGAEGQGENKRVCSKAERSRYFKEEGVANPMGCSGRVRSIRTEEDTSVLAAGGCLVTSESSVSVVMAEARLGGEKV